MGNDDGSRPRWPGSPGPGGSSPPGAQPYVPVVRTVPLRAVTPQPWPAVNQASSPPTPMPPQLPGNASSNPPKPAGHALAGTVVMQAAPILVPSTPPPPPPPAPPPRQVIEEAPYVEVPTRVAMMSDWPTDHPANEIFRNRAPATRRDRKKSGRTLLLVFGLALGVGGIAAGVFFGLRATASTKTKAPASGQPVVASSEAPPIASTPASSTPSASTAASSSVSAAPSATPSALAPPPDLAKLLSYEAYLTVSSSVDAEVLVQGVLAGKTNTWLLVRCGSRNVRLRKSDGAWLTKGEAMKVPCMKATTLTVEP